MQRKMWLTSLFLLIICISFVHHNERTETIEYVPEPTTAEEPVNNTEYEVYEVTAYTSGYESTFKRPDHPAYGLTASGTYVKEGRTIAASRSLPFGTRVYIPELNTTYIVEDRGGDITEGRLDIYMDDVSKALNFGRQELEVIILD